MGIAQSGSFVGEIGKRIGKEFFERYPPETRLVFWMMIEPPHNSSVPRLMKSDKELEVLVNGC